MRKIEMEIEKNEIEDWDPYSSRMTVLTENLVLSAACSTASLACSRGNLAVTIFLMSIFPEATNRIALGQVSLYLKRNLMAISFVEQCMNGKLRCDFPTPMTKTRPAVLVASDEKSRRGREENEGQSKVSNLEKHIDHHLQQAVPIELSTPVHSIETEG